LIRAVLFSDAIEVLSPTKEELVASQRRGGIQSVIEFIGGQGLKFFSVLENHSDTVASRNVNLAGCGHR
jgi:hypothetical protein